MRSNIRAYIITIVIIAICFVGYCYSHLYWVVETYDDTIVIESMMTGEEQEHGFDGMTETEVQALIVYNGLGGFIIVK